jgi:nucleoside-diphosphate-sugar epimerase
MKYVITGATGFIGKALVDYLLKSNHEVYAVSRSIERVRLLWPNCVNLHAIGCEMTNYKDLSKLIDYADIFVHLAWAGTTVDERYSDELQEKNIQATLTAMNAAKEIGCRLFAASGSQAEYGLNDSILTEDSPCQPQIPYGRTKLEMLNKCNELGRSINMPYLHLRICSVFGKGDHQHTLISIALEKLKKNEPLELTQCTQFWNFLYVKDMAFQIERLCAAILSGTAEPGIFLMASDDTRQLKSYMEEMKKVLNSSSNLLYGARNANNVVSLNPDVTKLKTAIGKLTNYTFNQALLDMQL